MYYNHQVSYYWAFRFFPFEKNYNTPWYGTFLYVVGCALFSYFLWIPGSSGSKDVNVLQAFDANCQSFQKGWTDLCSSIDAAEGYYLKPKN